MEGNVWLAFAGVAVVVIVVPGPAALLCVNHGMQHGWRRAFATVLGGTLSAAVLMGLSALGVWQLATAAPRLFEVARGCGAAWLLWLGVGTWRSTDTCAPRTGCANARSRSLARLCGDGFLLGIANPKDLLFFGALLPQFLDAAAPRAPQFACMFVTWAVVDGVAMAGYAALGGRLLGWTGQPRHRRRLQRASGAVLMAAGLTLGVAGPT
jgi:homoserine/homoserine lactone efflux protein